MSKLFSAIVTGGSQGIGAAIVRGLMRENIATAILDLETPDKSVSQQSSEPPVYSICCDLSCLDSIQAAVAIAEEKLGPSHILINNVGIGGPFCRLSEVSEEQWDHIFAVNLKSIFRLCKILLPGMQRAKYGRIINIASVHGLQGSALSANYVASKHAVIGYTRALAAEWGIHGITCNAVCPGYIDTQMTSSSKAPKDYISRITKRTPLGRLGSVDEVASLVLYLLSPQAAFMNGSILTVDGGLSADLSIV